MSSILDPLTRSELQERLEAAGVDVEGDALERLLAHHVELRRWSPSLSLIGPGTAHEVVERHYAESLAGARWIRGSRLLDVGSGAGFPGLVVAATRPDVRAVLVERRQRKAAFLRAAARRMELEVEILEGDLREVLPRSRWQAVDSVALRAVRLDASEWQLVLDAATPEVTVVLWEGVEAPELPDALRREQAVDLAGRESRIVSYRRQEP